MNIDDGNDLEENKAITQVAVIPTVILHPY